ncbi:MAG: type II secretion system F family protein [Candidatus Peregrinibacteria bacterium]
MESTTIETPTLSGMPADASSPTNKKKSRWVTFKKNLASLNNMGMGKLRSLFIENVAMMIIAGLPLVDALQAQLLETRSKPMKEIIRAITTAVESGSPLWRAMDDQNFFSPYELSLIRIGEEGGNLARNMQYLAEQQEKDRALKAKVQMAMIYPSVVFVMIFVLVMGLGLFVLPNLVGVLISLNVPLPLATRVVIAISKIFEAHGILIVSLTLSAVVFFFLLAKFTRFRSVSQWLVYHIPGVGTLAREATIAQFGVIVGGLLRAGVPLVDTLSSLVNVTDIVAYRRFYAEVYEHILAGDSFSKTFVAIKRTSSLLPISVQQLIMTGERSGSLADVLMKIAEIHDRKAQETAEKLPTILEPILLLSIGGIVATIAFAIIIPIYSVVGSLGK